MVKLIKQKGNKMKISNDQFDAILNDVDSSSSNKGLALAIDQFLVENKGKAFPAMDLAERFGAKPSKVRAIARNILGIGTREAALFFFLSPFLILKEQIIVFSSLILLMYLFTVCIGLICWLIKPIQMKKI